MKCGCINCDCGSVFYFETNSSKIKCINCSKEHGTIDHLPKESELEIISEDE